MRWRRPASTCQPVASGSPTAGRHPLAPHRAAAGGWRPSRPGLPAAGWKRRAATALRVASLAATVLITLGALTTPTLDQRPLLLVSPQASVATYVKTIDPVMARVLATDTAARAVLALHTRHPAASALTSALAAADTQFGSDLEAVRAMKRQRTVPAAMAASHDLAAQAISAVREHYRALAAATRAKNPGDQQRLLLAAEGFDDQYARTMTAYRGAYRAALMATGVRLRQEDSQ